MYNAKFINIHVEDNGFVNHVSNSSVFQETESYFMEALDSGLRKLTFHFAMQVGMVLQSEFYRGGFEGYNFLFDMPECERDEWIRKAIRQYYLLHKEDSEKYPCVGFKEAFDCVRAYRKSKRVKAKQSKS